MRAKHFVVAVGLVACAAWAASNLTRTEKANWVFGSNVSVQGKYMLTPVSYTIPDDGVGGGGGAAAYTLDPAAGVYRLTCSDTENCTVTIAEGNAASGQLLVVVNAPQTDGGGGTIAFADTAGLSETTGAITLGLNDSLLFVYSGDRFVELGTSNN